METKWAFLVTMVSGKVFRAVVDGHNVDHADKVAMRAVQEVCPEDVWDTSVFPNPERLSYGVAEIPMPSHAPKNQERAFPRPAVPPQRLGR